jgi:RND family efflux transporter MFP subunit
MVFSSAFVVFATTAAGAGDLGGFDCLIEPQTVVEVSTREYGVLEELLVGRGDLVEEGQPIARLNRSVEQATVELARARAESSAEIDELRETLAFAQRERERIDQLSSAKAVSFTEQDKATTEARRAELKLQQALERQRITELELERARRQLENRTVRSPVDGVVMERLMAPGESTENRPIVRLAKIDPLNVEIIVPVDHFGDIRTGMRAEVTPRYPGARVQEATVTIVDRVVDAASDTFGVRLQLPNPDYAIPGGVRCGIRFLDAPGRADTAAVAPSAERTRPAVAR